MCCNLYISISRTDIENLVMDSLVSKICGWVLKQHKEPACTPDKSLQMEICHVNIMSGIFSDSRLPLLLTVLGGPTSEVASVTMSTSNGEVQSENESELKRGERQQQLLTERGRYRRW